MFATKNEDFYKSGREFDCKITAGNKTYGRDEIISFELEHTQDTSKFIGATIGKSLKIKLFDENYKDEYWLDKNNIKVELTINNAETYVLGDMFKVDTVNRGRVTTEILLTDPMVWMFGDKYVEGTAQDTTTMQSIVGGICSKFGIEMIAPDYFDLFMEITNPVNFTYREVLGFIAAANSCNVFSSNEKVGGKHVIKFVSMASEVVVSEINKNHYYSFEVDKNKLTVNKVNVELSEGFGYTQYQEKSEGILVETVDEGETEEVIFPENEQITVNIPFGNQDIADNIYDKLKGQIQYGYKLKWLGDPTLEPCDLIEVTDSYDGQKYKVRLVSSKLTFSGGIVMENSCTAMTETNTTGSYVENKLGSYIKVLSDRIELNVNEINETINSTIEAGLEATKDSIVSTVSETFITREEDEEYRNYITSQLTQQKESFDMTFSNVQQSLSDLENHKIISETNINFSEEGITIGKNDSKFKSVFTNEELAFIENNTKVAYINASQFYITDGEVTNQMRIGNFIFLPRRNGNTSIKYSPKNQ